MGTTTQQIEAAIAAAGLVPRGVVRLTREEQLGELAGLGSLVLIGLTGRRGWDSFAHSMEARDGIAHPMDRWSKRIIDRLARQLGGVAIYPFGGPPFWPFQRWAQRAEPLFPSPLGLLIHPDYGLWHSYRGALAFSAELTSTQPPPAASPCESCRDKPCLSACPVGAFTVDGYAVDTCAAWLRTDPVPDCMTLGCRARNACPVGTAFAHAADQAEFGMRAFLSARE